jgi:hypothetical protein
MLRESLDEALEITDRLVDKSWKVVRKRFTGIERRKEIKSVQNSTKARWMILPVINFHQIEQM